MGSHYIQKEARRLVRQHGTRDPFTIAERLGIIVLYDAEFDRLKGMYHTVVRSRFITINDNLSDRDQRTICAHEIGHDRLHRHLAKDKALQEFMLYDMRSKPEYEANIFAAELLIDNNDILSLVESEYDIYQMAGELGEDMNLILIKIDEMRKQGYDLRVPYRPSSDFLGRE